MKEVSYVCLPFIAVVAFTLLIALVSTRERATLDSEGYRIVEDVDLSLYIAERLEEGEHGPLKPRSLQSQTDPD